MRLLVLLHGAGDTPQVWQDVVAALPSGTKAVAPWLRGLRPARDDRFSVPGAADDVLGLLNTHGVEQMALVGWQLGATVALDVATRAPETVSSLVLLSPEVAPPASVVRAQRWALRLTPARRLASLGVDKERALAALDALADADPRDRLGAVTARTLVLVGARDAARHPGAAALAAGIPGATLETIPGAGPTPLTEAPAAVNDLVFGFLAG